MEKFVRTAELCERLGIRRPTLHRWRRSGLFPEPKVLGPGSVGWPESVLEEWAKNRPDAGRKVNHE